MPTDPAPTPRTILVWRATGPLGAAVAQACARRGARIALQHEDADRDDALRLAARLARSDAIVLPLACPDDPSKATMECRVGGTISETRADGETAVWGTVLAFDAPKLVRFTWHPGREPDTAQEVEVTFAEHEGGTRVELTHTGWDRLGEKAEETRSGYDSGWDFVLVRYTG